MGPKAVPESRQVGKDVTDFAIGDRITPYNVARETPPDASEGGGCADPILLPKSVIGVNMGTRGAYAEYISIPARCCFKLDPSVPSAIAVLAEPVSVAAHGLDRAQQGWGNPQGEGPLPSSAVVLGCGPIGLCTLLMLKQRGVDRVVMGDIDPEKLARAEEWGGVGVSYSPADAAEDVVSKLKAAVGTVEAPEAPMLVVDCVGIGPSFATSAKLVARSSEKYSHNTTPMLPVCRPVYSLTLTRTPSLLASSWLPLAPRFGCVLMIGNISKDAKLDLQDITSREYSVVGSYGFDYEAFAAAVEAMPDLSSRLEGLLNGICGLAHAPAVFEQMAKKEVVATKIVIFPWRDEELGDRIEAYGTNEVGVCVGATCACCFTGFHIQGIPLGGSILAAECAPE